ncbi:MAG: hypothetical protein EBU52_08190, partial [Cytophagia bacterium]|nr:hypothetical protein [Cytophagia bacterium]
MKHGIAQKIENQYGKDDQGLILLQQEIDTWLNAVHQYCPIEIALQPDYYNNFDNKYSAWHEQSIIMVVPILEKWLSEPEALYRSHDSEFSHLCIFVKEITSYLN